MYGIDRAANRLGVAYLAGALGVSTSTIATWRRKDPTTALQKAIQKAGNQTEFGKIVGVAQKTVSNWLTQDIPVKPEKPVDNAVQRAVKVAGNQPSMAADLGVSQQCIATWCRQGYVPPARAQEIEMRYGVPRAELINPKLRNALGAGGEL
jgi:DNA-binding transcriptional regulator YdaS (Cro superfamily)